MDQQIELLTNLLSFYKRKYPGEFENKFNTACEDLIETKDVERKVYLNFCLTNDIEPTIKKKNIIDRRTGGSSYSGGYSTSSC